MLFNEARQELFELDDGMAFVWNRLTEGTAIDRIAEEVAGRGLPDGQVRAWLDHAVSEWTRLGLLRSPALRQRLGIGGACIEIRYATAALAEFAAPDFRHLEAAETAESGQDGRVPDCRLDLAEEDGAVMIRRGAVDLATCRRDEIIPALRGALTLEALGRGRYEVALHAATVAAGGHALLLSGCPGAGKSTLAVALAHSGLGLAGDDVALLGADGRVTGLRFAPALKPGSWPLLAGMRPDLFDLPVHVRYDSQRVRFLDGVPAAGDGPLPVRWIVSLDRRDGTEPALRPLDPLETLRDLIGGAASADDRLGTDAFQALARTLDAAGCHRLTYSRLDDAVALLVGLCGS
ncbi:ATP-binding protein [Skermanella pratensis]|uniref:ATP-binding protein n=1 Tax=Skermanella pratensis TaxID=2233999 RepID=UPI0013013CEB|nr:ATP-binding protein [Skermanella pratensis]